MVESVVAYTILYFEAIAAGSFVFNGTHEGSDDGSTESTYNLEWEMIFQSEKYFVLRAQ